MSKRVDKIDKWGRVAGVEEQIRGSAVNAAVQINEPMTLTMAPIQEIGCKSIKIQVCKLLYFVQANTKQIDDKSKQLSLKDSLKLWFLTLIFVKYLILLIRFTEFI